MNINPDLIKSIKELNGKKFPLKKLSKEDLYVSSQNLVVFFKLLWNIDQNHKNQLNKKNSL